MASHIVTSLQLDKEILDVQVITVKELRSCDSTFITSCILGHIIKNKIPTLLICAHNSVTHYHNVGLRMFYDLKKCINSGTIDVFDLGEESINTILSGKQFLIKNVCNTVQEKIRQMNENHSAINVIIDGVTHLFDLGFSLKEINAFCKGIIDEVRSCHGKGFVMFHCSVSGDDDTSSVLSNQLCHMAHTVVEVEGLLSGWSTDVSGHISFSYRGRKFEIEHLGVLVMQPSQYHFKLFDKGVTLFAPGSI